MLEIYVRKIEKKTLSKSDTPKGATFEVWQFLRWFLISQNFLCLFIAPFLPFIL
jgi:hypothetical protein